MKLLIAALGVACILTGCFATSGDLESAVADITGRIDVVARDGQESAEAAREAWKRGEITYANSDAITYPIGIITYPDATGVNAYIYTDLASFKALPESHQCKKCLNGKVFKLWNKANEAASR